MRFLKKASYKDIIGKTGESQFHYYGELAEKCKEFELFLTEKDLDELLDKKDFDQLDRILRKNGAVITAIHCPESKFRTCNEGLTELSSNYLSLCEVIRDSDSQEIFKKLLMLADQLYQAQYKDNMQVDHEDGEYENYQTKKNNNIIVIIHEGCEKGCINANRSEELKCDLDATKIADTIRELVEDLEIKSFIQIAIENVTPFYSTTNTEMKIGCNCGWNASNQKSKKSFFEEMKDKLKDTGICIGSCIDFCHILVSSKILEENKSKVEVIEEYLQNIDYSEYIFLFHVSNFGEDLSHGQLFSFEKEDDKKAIENIRIFCNKLAPKAPITFEVADGTDMEKASLNYEHIMFYFSNKHLFGRFGELLNDKANEELKDFFDELFIIYSYDKENIFEITNALWRVKQIVLKNTSMNQKKEEQLFGFDFDKTEVNLSIVRLKAYVYYTRFCNLGNYLAEHYYSGNNCIWDKEENIFKDFGLAMKYFIFNDRIHQCIYTGIQYKFLIDFLPKKVSFVRFNDGIENVNEMKLQSDNVFKEVISKIPGHISGSSIEQGRADFYSVGKNFAQCLFKYFDSTHDDWSVKIYENMPINYVSYQGKKYSIQAFTQSVLTESSFITKDEKIDLSLDISKFSSGRDGKQTDTLLGFIKYFDENLNFIKEKVASITDEEILFTNLSSPKSKMSYHLTDTEGVILKKICLGMIGKKEEMLPNKLFFENVSPDSKDDGEINKLKLEINKINENKNHDIWKITEQMKENLCNSNMTQQSLEDLNPYYGNDKDIYERLNKYIQFVREDKKSE